ncbi:MAG TPA: preprotein translocase subunit SecA [Candidatus Babeliales bacterium]|nr:preprotein translocase subunit SecA [Candidatus Babeliales bacterium]
MISNLLAKVFGTANARELKRLEATVRQINAYEPQISNLTDEQLTEKTNAFRLQLAQGKTLDEILPEAFAVVRETAKRKIGQRHYDVQLIGGIVLHQGKIAEMKTGEGKTLTATLPLYLNALAGKGAHLVTVNDYLARRDAEWMRPVYEHLGLSVAVLQHGLNDEERKAVYNSDIVYATNNELGFDYLRDNMKFRLEDYVQRELVYAIVDEVDSILIDEARTPLIISGAADESSELYVKIDKIVGRLQKETDYEVDEKARSVQLTEAGNDKVEQALGVKNLYDVDNLTLLHHVTQALKAHALFHRDVEYMVVNGEVLIIDEFTGRTLPGRRYSDGLHQALEAKEGVEIERETQTLAAITLQNFFRLYQKLAGMTGTAVTEAEEFHNIYKLDVVVIPTNEALIRLDQPDFIFLTRTGKYKAVVADIKGRVAKQQPVLVGTISVETSELLSTVLQHEGIKHEVLNAKYHEREAEIVALAGEPGRVTIATNMAGRGTDIKLAAASKLAGGLYILGTERHESRRIDNQLRGRSGRQGDPGESRFYISLEDDLIRIFAGDTLKQRMQRFGMTEDETVESPLISRTIEQAQEKVERHNFELRRNVIEYDDVLNNHRLVIYRYRREILELSENSADIIRDFIAGTVEDTLSYYSQKRDLTQEQRTQILRHLSQIAVIPVEQLQTPNFSQSNYEQLESDLINLISEQYALYRQANNSEQTKLAERWLMLETIDKAWKQHMLNIDHLKEGISYRSWGQKNPLVEYKKEAFIMFTDMMRNIRWEIVHHIFHLNLNNFNARELEQRRERELQQMQLVSGKAAEAAAEAKQPVRREAQKVGRNDDCACGSGKKYKKCCGAKS